MPQKTQEELLAELQEREFDTLQAKKDRIEALYEAMPKVIWQVAQLTGLPEDIILRASSRASWYLKDREWYQLLDNIRAFHIEVKRLMMPENGEEV